jgi:hypothetical protein
MNWCEGDVKPNTIGSQQPTVLDQEGGNLWIKLSRQETQLAVFRDSKLVLKYKEGHSPQ